MRRRNFIKQGITAGSAMMAPASLLMGKTNDIKETGTPFKMNYAFHDGRLRIQPEKILEIKSVLDMIRVSGQ